MKRKRCSESQQPTIDTAYIDFLLSGEKPKGTRKPIPKKLWFFLGGAVLVALLCLFLPNMLANLQVEMWQARCAEAYDRMRAGVVGHYTQQATLYKAGEEPEVLEMTEVWTDGENRLTHRLKTRPTLLSVPPDDQSLRLDGQIYSRNITPQDPDPLWEWKRSVSKPSVETSTTWLDTDYVFSSIRADLSGVQVTYTKEINSNGIEGARAVFCFDLLGNCTSITQSLEYTKQQRMETTCITVCNTDPEEIQAIFDRCRQEVEKIEKWIEE